MEEYKLSASEINHKLELKNWSPRSFIVDEVGNLFLDMVLIIEQIRDASNNFPRNSEYSLIFSFVISGFYGNIFIMNFLWKINYKLEN